MTLQEAELIIEALIFAAESPLSAEDLGEIVGLDRVAVRICCGHDPPALPIRRSYD